jgi:hypothetical protein
MTTDTNTPSATAEATTETLTYIVHVKTCPYECIAEFGYRLAMFAKAHPGVRFSWHEADYVDLDDGDDDVVIDNVTVFERDPEWSTFLINFEDQVGYDTYETWGR